MEMALFRKFIIFNVDVFYKHYLALFYFFTGRHNVRVFGDNIFYLLDSSFHHSVVRTLDVTQL